MTTVFFSLASVLLVSLVSLSGLLTLSLNEVAVRRLSTFFVSFAVGALLGDSFIHLIPQAFAGPHADPIPQSLLVLCGIVLFFMLEKLLRHTHGPLHRFYHGAPERARPELAAINLLGDAIHNFIDGVVIGASYLASPTVGLSTTIAVLLHEIPQELGDFAILVHSGLDVRQAVRLNLASASVAVLGTLTALAAGRMSGHALSSLLLPITAGGFVYLACADLIPELQHDRSLRAMFVQTGLIGLGICAMALLALLE